MSTNYYEICEKCLAHEEHMHRKSDIEPVARSSYDLIKGTQVSGVHNFRDDVKLISEYDEVITVAELRAKIGNGKKDA